MCCVHHQVLQNNRLHPSIPNRFIVGQRLAQCMHPLLPSGVHLKALETYDLIFNCIGPERLLAELTIYSNGLFPLLSYAAINVRPALLDLYERRLSRLGEGLKPALDGFLIGVLPGLEEGSEFFDRTDKLLSQIAESVGSSHFYGALWKCIMKNSSIRLPAISFIILHFNKKRPISEQSHIFGLCMPTLVRAICAALLDANILVQRAILDLLLICFPLHMNLKHEMEDAMASPGQRQSTDYGPGGPSSGATVISEASEAADAARATSATLKSPSRSSMPFPGSNSGQPLIHRYYFKRPELVAIITAALTVLLRRDLSLNRRLCAWFFGADSSSSSSTSSSASPSSSQQASGKNAASGVGSMFKQSSSTFLSSSNTIGGGASTSAAASSNSNQTNNSGENKTKKKKTIYFENNAKDLVLEAFKRCITVITFFRFCWDLSYHVLQFVVVEPRDGHHLDLAGHVDHQLVHPVHVAVRVVESYGCSKHHFDLIVAGQLDQFVVAPALGLQFASASEHHHLAPCVPAFVHHGHQLGDRHRLQRLLDLLAVSAADLHPRPARSGQSDFGDTGRRYSSVSLLTTKILALLT